jgi:ribosomal protein S18 acetylase RimI-like enzyme
MVKWENLMATLISTPITAELPTQLRPFDPLRDLNPVADLVELCFADTLDPDGHRYLRQMRSAARSPNLARLAERVSGAPGYPIAGFVWEEHGNVIGNLSLIPFKSRGRRIYLIANVAVHPDHRRRGVARGLTTAALEYLRRSGAELPWLQVRDDNPAAIQLYNSSGFEERYRRTTWHSQPGFPLEAPPGSARIQPARGSDWSLIQSWFQESYPLELGWNLPFSRHAARTDWFGLLYRLFSGTFMRQWTVKIEGKLAGAIFWQATSSFANALWLSVHPDYEEAAAQALTHHVVASYGRQRTLALEIPTGFAQSALAANGFRPSHTLIWMHATHY